MNGSHIYTKTKAGGRKSEETNWLWLQDDVAGGGNNLMHPPPPTTTSCTSHSSQETGNVDLGNRASRHAHEPSTRMTSVHPVAPESLEKLLVFPGCSSSAADGIRQQVMMGQRYKKRTDAAVSGIFSP